jgi:glycerate kinase
MGTGADEPLVLAAPDKFRGTVTATEASEAMARGAASGGWRSRRSPLSDGGDGLLEVLGPLDGEWGEAQVTGPLGEPVTAAWLRVGDVAIVEMARASGLALVGGAEGNDAMAATSRGTGELIVVAARSLSGRDPIRGDGAALPSGPGRRGRMRTVVVGLGGSATTDGGLGAVAAIEESGALEGIELVGACDVDVAYLEAARQFARQKGADDAQIVALESRLHQVAANFEARFAVDVLTVEGAGAAGGLGGALVALGGTLRSGYEVVTELLGFHDELAACQLVVTGEGALDSTSFAGKVVGSVARDGRDAGIPVLVVAGRASSDAVESAGRLGAHVVSLSDVFGEDRALNDTAACIETSVALYVRSVGGV